jgi:hypothetical protein
VPHAEIIRGLGLLAATFAVQTNVPLADFLEGMAGYHQGVRQALGLPLEVSPLEEPAGPSLILP